MVGKRSNKEGDLKSGSCSKGAGGKEYTPQSRIDSLLKDSCAEGVKELDTFYEKKDGLQV